jgi:hypothetical protein
MKLIDHLHLTAPFFGSKNIVVLLKSDGHIVNWKRVRRLMSIIAIRVIYRRSVIYEEVYLKVYDDARDARTNLDKYFRFYNNQRPHQTLEYRTTAKVFGIQAVTNKGSVVESIVSILLIKVGSALNISLVLS